MRWGGDEGTNLPLESWHGRSITEARVVQLNYRCISGIDKESFEIRHA